MVSPLIDFNDKNITRLNLSKIIKNDINLLWKEKVLEENFIDFQVPLDDKKKKQLKLFTYRYSKTNNPKGVIVYLHGYNDYSYETDYSAKLFGELDLIYVSFDFRGHGNSEGETCYFENVDQLILDAKKFIKIVKEMYPNLPFFLSGFSMGGLIAYKISHEFPEDFIGVILYAPALKTNVGCLIRSLVSCLGIVFCGCGFEVNGEASNTVRNPISIAKIQRDRFYKRSILHFESLRALMKKMNSSEATFKTYKPSFIIFMGGNDKVINPKSAFRLVNMSPSNDKHLYFYDEMYHFMLGDDEVFDVLERSRAFILKKLSEYYKC